MPISMIRGFILALLSTTCLFSHEDYSKIASIYVKRDFRGTNYLAFRDIPALFSQCFPIEMPLAILDYGCGTGRSTRFIQKTAPLNSTVIGVDISEAMLAQAERLDPLGAYFKMEKRIPFPDATFDFVYSNFVLFELESQSEITEVLNEIQRTMKPGGYLIATTGAPPMYVRQNQWATLSPDFPQNDHPKSGSIVKIKAQIPGGDTITFDDYYWTEEDYQTCFIQAGLTLLKIHHPLGKLDETIDWQWKDEIRVSPYVTFVLKK